ncbi:MAG: DNA repair protein RecO [Robiginitomaculum sp.]|nr:MAG: DNA repair protein RecO [Robiginitomaculum sp.]
MEWQDRAIILMVRSHGESSAIVEVLTPQYGRHAGLVRGATGKRLRGILQPGNVVDVHWRARLSEHLGTFSFEAVEARAPALFDNALALGGLASASAMASLTLPEREAQPHIFEAFDVLIAQMPNVEIWPALYVRWEAGVLRELGYGLQLDRCAATGSAENLTHVSPRSGQAVCAEAAKPYLDKLLILPGFLRREPAPLNSGDVLAGLTLTGYFLERRVLWPVDKVLPEARKRMIERLEHGGHG